LDLVNDTIATVVSIVQDIKSDYIEKIKLLLLSGLEYFIVLGGQRYYQILNKIIKEDWAMLLR